MQLLKLMNSLSASILPLTANSVAVEKVENLSNDEAKVLDLVKDFISEEKDLIKNIGDKFDEKLSAKKNIQNLIGNKDKEIFKKFVDSMQKKGMISQDQHKNLYNSNEAQTKFNKELHSLLVKSLKEIKTVKTNTNKEAKSYYKRIVTDIKNKFAVNDDGVESSKNVENKILDFKNLLDKIKSSVLDKMKLADRLLTASTVITGISIVTGATAAALYATAAVTFGATAVPASLLSIATGILGVVASTLKVAHYHVVNSIQSFEEINNILSEYKSTTVGKMAKTLISSCFSFTKLKYDIVDFNRALDPGTISKISSYIRPVISTVEVIKDIKELNKFRERNIEIQNKAIELADIISHLKNVKWVVVNETILDKPYNEGGVGGVNTHFKNQETGEIKTLEELLKLSDFELSANGLVRVRDSKKGEYLRTFPNKIKWDNLG
ncbi:hypothetical protein [Metamycoplasma auris]|uniref:Uncharacterized protein n=1 Tax=Metamycoplasma auris TaxID=51363 RepID=A0A2W7G6M0_9BACT|nr:hypothetical protein [Metamycoplasma auris]PZV99237.1 hypothetical protein BCF89_1095 [Metamycoplasma auris]